MLCEAIGCPVSPLNRLGYARVLPGDIRALAWIGAVTRVTGDLVFVTGEGERGVGRYIPYLYDLLQASAPYRLTDCLRLLEAA